MSKISVLKSIFSALLYWIIFCSSFKSPKTRNPFCCLYCGAFRYTHFNRIDVYYVLSEECVSSLLICTVQCTVHSHVSFHILLQIWWHNFQKILCVSTRERIHMRCMKTLCWGDRCKYSSGGSSPHFGLWFDCPRLKRDSDESNSLQNMLIELNLDRMLARQKFDNSNIMIDLIDY